MNKEVSYSISNGVMNIFIDGEAYTVSKDHPEYNNIWRCLMEESYEKIENLVDLGKAISVWGNEVIVVKAGQVYYKGEKLLDEALVIRMIAMIKQGEDYHPMAKFIDNLMQNPDKNVIPQVYKFLRKNMLPITKDGYFLAYKKVNSDYKDCHSGKIDNSVGITVKEDRSLVDPDPNKTCSKGLHVCSFEYLKHFGGDKLLLCKVNPRDVVAVPIDYDDSKLRCCEYFVYSDITGESDPRMVYEQKIVWDSVPVQKPIDEDKADGCEEVEEVEEVEEEELITGQVVYRDSKGRFTKKN